MKTKIAMTKAASKRARESRALSPVAPALNRQIYRDAFAQYRRWSRAKEIERVRDLKRLGSAGHWRQYCELWEFGKNAQNDRIAVGEKASMLAQYYRLAQELRPGGRHGARA